MIIPIANTLAKPMFPTVKLLDYADKWDELEKSDNPFALVVMAHLKTQETRKNHNERKRWKICLVRKLYERGYKKQDIINLFHFIDWITKPVYIDELLKRLQAHLKLEWIYEDKVEIRATAIQSVQSSVIPPPQELLAEFHKLLMEGDVCGIQELAENLSDSDSEYRLFLDRIHQMAKKFLMNELEKYITQYMD